MVDAFLAGDHSDAIIRAMLEMGYTREAIEDGGYTGDYFKSNGGSTGSGSTAGGPEVDMISVRKLGYGKITPEYLEQLVRDGKVEEYEVNGVLKYRRRYG